MEEGCEEYAIIWHVFSHYNKRKRGSCCYRETVGLAVWGVGEEEMELVLEGDKDVEEWKAQE